MVCKLARRIDLRHAVLHSPARLGQLLVIEAKARVNPPSSSRPAMASFG